MVKTALRLFKAYEDEMNSINPDLKESVQQDKKQALNAKYAKDVGQTRTSLQIEAERLHAALVDAQNPVKELAKLAISFRENVTNGDLAIIQSLPGLPDEMLTELADQTTSPAIQLNLYSRVATRSGEAAAELRARVLSRVAVNRDQIQSLARQEKECWEALYAGCNIPGEHSSAKLNYAHQINALSEILKD